MRSGFVTLVGRPNVGKSSLVNALCGNKVSIVSPKPQTTRRRVRGIANGPDHQIVFVDTPGLHKPVTALGERINETALSSVADVDVVCLVLDATKPFGRGDQWVADRLVMSEAIVVINKCDAVSREKLLTYLASVAGLAAREYHPVSARTGEGLDGLRRTLVAMLPEGPALYPAEARSDTDELTWIAELVREQLLHETHDELPHSIATRVVEHEWPRIRCEIVVERESQKGMVIGKGGSLLKRVGTKVREQLPEGAYLELFVVVDPNWQRRPERIERLGY
jgi:GTP-binding protein Era